MNGKHHTALLASSGGAFWDALGEEFKKSGGWHVRRATDMTSAIRALEESPALLIADLTLCGGDGAALIAKKNESTRAMAVSHIRDGFFYALAAEVGAQDCMTLPAPVSRVVRRACNMLRHTGNCTVRNAVYAPAQDRLCFEQAQRRASRLLLAMSLPVTMDGFRYLCFAAAACACDETLVHAMTTRLYPMVAEEFHSTSARAERSMRYAVERVFDKADVALLHRAFGYSADPLKGKLSVGAFVAQLVVLLHTADTLHIDCIK